MATPGLSARFWGQLRDLPGGDGGCRHKPATGNGGMPGCPGAVERNPEAPWGKLKNNIVCPSRTRGNQKITPPMPDPAAFWGHLTSTSPVPPLASASMQTHRGKELGFGNPPPNPTGSHKPFIPSPSLIQPVTQGCPLGFQRGLPLLRGEQGFG